ncbi:insulinase family protein [Mariniflexile gromovii]|uniref:Insulinase family protein n=1 Tax=Mariniflexile gromovii TaxID=362523 RepID=A0ABS4BWI6_9FLAO|nr:insulinase family protein [Mariniflexile gromovii]MBP0904950.1 insulinase family protein [Mariniflexile gromovii]
MHVNFSCAPENVDKLIAKVFEEINKIKENGATPEDLNKIKEAEIANAKEYLEINGYRSYKLKEVYESGLNFESILDYQSGIDKLNSKTFQDAANTYFDDNNYAEFILIPEK